MLHKNPSLIQFIFFDLYYQVSWLRTNSHFQHQALQEASNYKTTEHHKAGNKNEKQLLVYVSKSQVLNFLITGNEEVFPDTVADCCSHGDQSSANWIISL